MQQLYIETGVHPADMEWDTTNVPQDLPLDIIRDAPYFTREIRREVPGMLQGTMYAALGMAGAKAIEAIAYGRHRPVGACGRKITLTDVKAAAFMCLSERYGDRQIENAGDYLWLHLVRVACDETPLDELVRRHS